MRIAAAASTFGHIAIIGWATIALPATEAFKTDPVETVPVEFIDLADLQKLRAGDKSAELKEEPAPKPKPEPEKAKEVETPKPVEQVKEKPAPKPEPKPKQVAALPPKPEPVAKQPPAPEPTPAPKPVVQPKPEPKPVAKPDPQPKPEPKKPVENFVKIKSPPIPSFRPRPPKIETAKKQEEDFNADNISALLNKLPDSGSPVPELSEPVDLQAPLELAAPVDLAPSFGLQNGEDTLALSVTEIGYLKSKVESCRNKSILASNREARGITVRVAFDLDSNGYVENVPTVVNYEAGELFRVASDLAVNAVLKCQPYDRLPVEKYDLWKSVTMNFTNWGA